LRSHGDSKVAHFEQREGIGTVTGQVGDIIGMDKFAA
jgi:hypothetical protein